MLSTVLAGVLYIALVFVVGVIVYREGFYHGWDDGFAEGVKAADIDNGHEDWWLPTTTEARLKGPR